MRRGVVAMLKTTVPPPGVLFASRMAWRNEPGALSLVLVTVKVAADAHTATHSATTLNIRRTLFMKESSGRLLDDAAVVEDFRPRVNAYCDLNAARRAFW